MEANPGREAPPSDCGIGLSQKRTALRACQRLSAPADKNVVYGSQKSEVRGCSSQSNVRKDRTSAAILERRTIRQ